MCRPHPNAAPPGNDVSDGTECYAKTLERGADTPSVLRGVSEAAGRKDRQQIAAWGGRASLVDDNGGRFEQQLVSKRTETQAEVNVLGVHEEALVQTVELLKSRSSHEETRTRNPFGCAAPFVGLFVANDLVGPWRSREKSVEEEGLSKR